MLTRLAGASVFLLAGWLARAALASGASYPDSDDRERDSLIETGDRCEDPFVLADTFPDPIVVNGDTSDPLFVNDYDEACPYSGSTAADVAYLLVPTSDVVVDITLCIMPTEGPFTAYDSKLYVYEEMCPPESGLPLACNDDACSPEPDEPAHVSAIYNLALTAGVSYYIIVDGYGTSEGPFHLEIIPRPEIGEDCPDGVFGQDTDLLRMVNSDLAAGLRAFENYSAGPEPITEVRWRGVTARRLNPFQWTVCEKDDESFEIAFYPDLGGIPDVDHPIGPYTVTPARTTTGEIFDGQYPVYEYAVELPEPCELGVGWVSIMGLSPADCWSQWLSSEQGNGESLLQNTETGTFSFKTWDLNLCLIATPELGACCYADGTCEIITRWQCEAAAVRCPADLNCDLQVDFDDIDPFVLALAGQAAYEAQFPECDWLNGDCNGDGLVDFDDIDAFVDLLASGSACTTWLGPGTECADCPRRRAAP